MRRIMREQINLKQKAADQHSRRIGAYRMSGGMRHAGICPTSLDVEQFLFRTNGSLVR